MSALLSMLVPGFGHLHLGRYREGLCFLLAWLGILLFSSIWALASFRGLALVAGTGLALLLGAAGHAWLQAARRPWPPRARGWFGLLPVALLLNFAVEPSFVLNLVPFARYDCFCLASKSMQPTLEMQDRVVVDRHGFCERPLQRQDLVLFKGPREPATLWLKRCVALPGDQVEVRAGQLFLNGLAQPGEAAQPDPEATAWAGPLTVPAGCFYCLGDNRPHSLDSRHLGPIPQQALRGRPLYIYWSKDRARIGRLLG